MLFFFTTGLSTTNVFSLFLRIDLTCGAPLTLLSSFIFDFRHAWKCILRGGGGGVGVLEELSSTELGSFSVS